MSPPTAATDVVIDARVVEEARKEPASGAGDLQSLSWTALSIGGFLGTALGGIVGSFYFDAPATILRLVFLGMIIAGVVGLHLAERTTGAA